MRITHVAAAFLCTAVVNPLHAPAADKPVVGLIPKATKPIKLDGKLDEWAGAFATPVHIGHPQYLNRGAEFFYLWDDDNLYIGLRCLDRTTADTGTDQQLWNGDAVEFYIDTRRDDLGAKEFAPGVLHMFFTPFTGKEVKPRLAARDLPHQKDIDLKGAEVGGAKTPYGYVAEFKLPWKVFPKFTAKSGEVIGMECELCSSDGGQRVDRTFVYAGPAAVGTPSAFGRLKLVDKLEAADLKTVGRALLPMSLSQSANYDWLYVSAGVSSAIAPEVAKLEADVLSPEGKVLKKDAGPRRVLEGADLSTWHGAFELFDLPAGTYALELKAIDRQNKVISSRKVSFLHGEPQGGQQVK